MAWKFIGHNNRNLVNITLLMSFLSFLLQTPTCTPVSRGICPIMTLPDWGWIFRGCCGLTTCSTLLPGMQCQFSQSHTHTHSYTAPLQCREIYSQEESWCIIGREFQTFCFIHTGTVSPDGCSDKTHALMIRVGWLGQSVSFRPGLQTDGCLLTLCVTHLSLVPFPLSLCMSLYL